APEPLYNVVKFLLATLAFPGVLEYKLVELVIGGPYLMLYWRYCLGCHTDVKRVCPPDHLPLLF
ncbi:hypothetical protein UFOVP841_38, partial [uncultured Caudovirales phage]